MANGKQSNAAGLQALAKQAVDAALRGVARNTTRQRRAGPTPQRRQANRRQMAAAAAMRSIPRTVATKEERFRNALSNLAFAPRGHGYYDAFAMQPEATIIASAVGPVTPVQGIGRKGIPGLAVVTQPSGDGDVTTNSRLIIFNPGSSTGVVGRIYTPLATAIDVAEISCPQFSDAYGFGPARTDPERVEDHYDGAEWDQQGPAGRVESIPLRGSLRIRNVTEALAVGGTVRVLRYNGGLNLAIDVAGGEHDPNSYVPISAYRDVCDMIRNAARTRHYSGEELRTSHQVNTHPADFVRSHTFHEDDSFAECLARPKYSSVLILIDDFAASTTQANNSYELNWVVQRAARFAPGTLLHSKAVTLPANANHVNREVPKEAAKDPLQPVRPAPIPSSRDWRSFQSPPPGPMNSMSSGDGAYHYSTDLLSNFGIDPDELNHFLNMVPIAVGGMGAARGAMGMLGREIGRAHRLNSSHTLISYAVFCLKKKNKKIKKKQKKKTKACHETHLKIHHVYSYHVH